MSTIHLYRQYRSLDYIYLLKEQVNQNLKVKIYDISQKCLFKKSFTDLDLSEVGTELSQRNLTKIVNQLQKRVELAAFFPRFVMDLMTDVEQLIHQLRMKVTVQHKELEKYSCPITLEVFQEPVIDEHGHTFEKKAIEAHLTKDKKCPISREPIHSLTPNRLVQQAIEEIQKQAPIPTFALFKKENKKLYDKNLKDAETYIAEGEYTEALECYSKALQYTNNWQDYSGLVDLFVQMGEKEKMQLACFYLMQYQLQANEPLQAIQTLEQYKDQLELKQIAPLLVKLYLSTNQEKKAAIFALESAQQLAKTYPKEALWLYEQVLKIDPYQFGVYKWACQLVVDSKQRTQLLLKGAGHAIEQGKYQTAQDFCKQVERNESFIDQLMQLSLLKEQSLIDPFRRKLLFLAKMYEQKGLINEQLKVYKLLSQLDYDKSYYTKIIACYKQLKKPAKLFQWYMGWLAILLEQKDWQRAESVAQEALKVTEQRIPIYEKLETIYSQWQGHKLQDLWDKLGKAYLDNKQLEQAEKTYRKAYERFGTFNQALSLADILQKKGKLKESVNQYYETSSIALLENRLDQLNLCTQKIRQIDPKMSHLDSNQRVQLLTQSQLFILSEELQKTKNKLQASKQELKGTQQELQKVNHDLEALSERLQSTTGELKLIKKQLGKEEIKEQVIVKPSVIEEKKEITIPSIAFGKAKWETYFGDVGIEPVLPSNIEAILNSSCPFWPDKKVKETHMLVLIPKTVNGKPLTLEYLGQLVQNPKQGNKTQFRNSDFNNYEKIPVKQSHWVLMTRDVIPESYDKSYEDQLVLVKTYNQKSGIEHEVPKLLDATVCIFLEYVQTGTRLYSDNSYNYDTYTRCQEKGSYGQMIVGGFFVSGLFVRDFTYIYGCDPRGVSVCRIMP